MLTVFTTHLKVSWIQRNGVALSDQAMSMLLNLAQPLAPPDRSPFLEQVAGELAAFVFCPGFLHGGLNYEARGCTRSRWPGSRSRRSRSPRSRGTAGGSPTMG